MKKRAANRKARKPDIAALMADGRLVDAALTAGVRAALLAHARAGLPVVEWRDGRTVEVPPREIRRRLRLMEQPRRTARRTQRQASRGRKER